MIQIKSRWMQIVPLLLVSLGSCFPSYAQEQVVGAVNMKEILPLDPATKTGKLSNGFTYYIRQNKEPKNKVVMYLVNKVGSVLEEDHQQGLAHFLEHMSFNGTTNFPGKTMVDFLEKAGVRFGADLNAYTSFDETVYQLPISIDNPQMLKQGLQVMRDWAYEATLDPIEINKERGVVLEEKRLAEGTKKRISDLVFPIMVNGSRYASRSPIGTEEVINNFDPQVIKSFYRDWYRPNLQALIVVGDVDVNAVQLMVEKLFSDLKNPVNEKMRVPYAIELKGENQFLAVTDPEIPVTNLGITIKHESQPLSTAGDYREMVIRGLFNQMVTARFASLSEKNASLYLKAGAGIGTFLANLESFSGSVTVRSGHLEKGFKAFWSEILSIRNQGFTSTELKQAKQSYLNAIKYALSEKDHKSSVQYVQEYTRHFTTGEASPGIQKEYELTDKFLAEIDLAAVTRIARKFITNINRDIIITAPENEKAILPGERMMNSWIDAVENAKSNLFHEEDSTILPLMSAIPTPGTIVSQTLVPSVEIVDLKLSNGARIILKPTKFKNDEINFTAFSPGGTSIYADADEQSAVSAAGIVATSGLGNLTAAQLRTTLNGKQLNVSPFIGESMEGISGSSTAKDLESALQLVYLYFTQPRTDSAIFVNNLSRARANLVNQAKSPESEFLDTINAVMNSYHIRRTGPSLAKLDRISLEKAFEIYKDRFADASDFTFIFTGSFDPTQIQTLLLKYLGGLPGIWRREKSKDLGIRMPKGQIDKTVYNGTAEKATVKLVIHGDYKFNEDNNLRLEALKGILGFRLIERLREKEGGVYTPSVGLSLSRFPIGHYSFTINFGCAPKNVDKLIAATWEEINKLKKEGIEKDDIQKYIAEEKVVVNAAVETNSFWTGYLSTQYQSNESPETILSYTNRLEHLSGVSLKKSASKYLSDKSYMRFVLLPNQLKMNK